MMSPRASSWIIKTLSSSALLLLLSSPIFAAYYGGSLRDHGHTGTGDGGVLTNLNVTGTVTASTVTASRVNSSTVTSFAVEASTSSRSFVFAYFDPSLSQVQLIPHNSYTNVAWGTEGKDILNEWNGTTFTATTEGFYEVSLHYSFNVSTNQVSEVSLIHTGLNRGFRFLDSYTTSANVRENGGSVVCYMAAGDKIWVMAYQTSGGSVNFGGGGGTLPGYYRFGAWLTIRRLL